MREERREPQQFLKKRWQWTQEQERPLFTEEAACLQVAELLVCQRRELMSRGWLARWRDEGWWQSQRPEGMGGEESTSGGLVTKGWTVNATSSVGKAWSQDTPSSIGRAGHRRGVPDFRKILRFWKPRFRVCLLSLPALRAHTVAVSLGVYWDACLNFGKLCEKSWISGWLFGWLA